jgi:hypothetical protein
MGKQTDAQPVFDFPAAWKSVEPTKTDQHHERCSYRQTDRALLCDCAAVIAAEAAWHLAHQEPAPDWADLREMARNAGFTHRKLARDWLVWTDKDVYVELRRRYIGGWRITLTGEFGDLSLNDPTPARFLAVAREMGLEVSRDVAS